MGAPDESYASGLAQLMNESSFVELYHDSLYGPRMRAPLSMSPSVAIATAHVFIVSTADRLLWSNCESTSCRPASPLAASLCSADMKALP